MQQMILTQAVHESFLWEDLAPFQGGEASLFTVSDALSWALDAWLWADFQALALGSSVLGEVLSAALSARKWSGCPSLLGVGTSAVPGLGGAGEAELLGLLG